MCIHVYTDLYLFIYLSIHLHTYKVAMYIRYISIEICRLHIYIYTHIFTYAYIIYASKEHRLQAAARLPKAGLGWLTKDQLLSPLLSDPWEKV